VLIRTGIIGTGFVSAHHVDAIRRTGLGQVVAIAGRELARTVERAAELGIDGAFGDGRALIEDPGIDVVHVCTPNGSHAELAAAAIEAGRHVVVEKPLALDSGAARELVALAEAHGVHAMVAFTYRGYPMVRRMRDLVAAGELGEVRLAHGHYLQDWLSRESDYNWRIDPAIGGESRAVADIGSHWFDTIEFVTGRRVAAVQADIATFIRERDRPLARAVAFGSSDGPTERVRIQSEDAATILVRFDEEAIGTCVVSQVSPGHKNDFSIEVTGSERSIRWFQEAPELAWLGGIDASTELSRRPDATTSGIPSLPAGHPEGWGEAFRDLFRPFYGAIAAGDDPRSPGFVAPYPTLRDGARAVAFVEAVLASAAAGRWVELEAT
jgi:predicted dehydrogenase